MVSAIILSGGSGKRMESGTPKQFMEIGGKPLIYYALSRFEASIVDEIVLVTRKQDMDRMRSEVVERYGFRKIKRLVPGGAERYNSVYNGLKNINRSSDVVLIHDGARPFVTNSMILESIRTARKYKACTVAVPVKDTIKVVDEDMNGIETPDRRMLYAVQTPQAFDVKTLLEAYKRMHIDGSKDATDDTMIVEKYIGINSRIIEGDYRNIKVTTPDDIAVCEAYIAN